MSARGLAVLIAALLLGGCVAQVEDEGCEDMSGRVPLDDLHNRPEHWGATKIYSGPWANGQYRTVIDKPPFKMNGRYCVPQVQSLLLIAQVQKPGTGGNNIKRWAIHARGGGSGVVILLDVLNTQQVSVAAENLRVDVVSEPYDPTQVYQPGDDTTSFTVGIADGNVTSGQATYTQAFQVNPASILLVPVPQMATSFQLVGHDGSSTSPFVAGFTISEPLPLWAPLYIGSSFNQYTGTEIPLNGNARSLLLNNTTGNIIQCGIVWGLDL